MAAVARTRELRAPGIEVRSTRDRVLLREFLEGDRLFSAYALCDLDEREFARTRWGVALSGTAHRRRPRVHRARAAAALRDGRDAVDRRTPARPHPAANRVPGRAPRAACREIERVYRVDPGPPDGPHVGGSCRLPTRHRCGRRASSPPTSAISTACTTSASRRGCRPNRSPTGIYYGVRLGGRLVAAAGTHVVSREARLAVVGNVMTHQTTAAAGYAKLTTGPSRRTCCGSATTSCSTSAPTTRPRSPRTGRSATASTSGSRNASCTVAGPSGIASSRRSGVGYPHRGVPSDRSYRNRARQDAADLR